MATPHTLTMTELTRCRSRLFDMAQREPSQRIKAEYDKARTLVNDAVLSLLRAEYIEQIER